MIERSNLSSDSSSDATSTRTTATARASSEGEFEGVPWVGSFANWLSSDSGVVVIEAYGYSGGFECYGIGSHRSCIRLGSKELLYRPSFS